MAHSCYTVDRHSEADCPRCGAPLFEGDQAWEVDSPSLYASGFCSKRCMLAMEADRRHDAWVTANITHPHIAGQPHGPTLADS